MSSHRIVNRVEGVGIYIHNGLKSSIKAKSRDITCNPSYNIDYILIELIDCKIEVCCMYCPPGCNVTVISNTIASIKHLVSYKYSMIIGSDYNINLLEHFTDVALELINSVNFLS